MDSEYVVTQIPHEIGWVSNPHTVRNVISAASRNTNPKHYTLNLVTLGRDSLNDIFIIRGSVIK